MDRLVRIEQDMFDIALRLKNIDHAYYPVYNLTRHRYEIHHREQRPTLSVVLPYSSLDTRALNYVIKTRVDDWKLFVTQLDEQNIAIEKRAADRIRDKMAYKSKHLIAYLEGTRSKIMPDYESI